MNNRNDRRWRDRTNRGRRMSDNEIYVSVDIETNGPIPGPNSMLSLGAAAFRLGQNKPVSTFTVNFEELEGSTPDPKTMTEFWDKNPEAWKACRTDIVPPKQGIKDFVDWVNSLDGKPVFVGFPVTFDFLFVYWYMIKFLGSSPFSFSALDIKTLAMPFCGSYRGATKRNMPKHWFQGTSSHTHVALDDAIEQGILFLNIMREYE